MTEATKSETIQAEESVTEQTRANLERKIAKRQKGAEMPRREKRIPSGSSMGAVYASTTLQTTYAQKLYVESFNRTCKALYYLSFILYEQIKDESLIDEAAKLNAGVEEQLNDAIEEMEGKVEILNATMAARPELQSTPIEFSSPHDLKIQVTTPRIMQLKRLLELCDEWHTKATLLWTLNAMSDADRVREVKKVQGNFRGVCNKVIDLHNQVESQMSASKKGKGVSLTT